MVTESRSSERPEAWVVVAWAIVAAEIGLAIYLGMKQPGVGPVRAYTRGPLLLIGAALVTGLAGAIIGALRRPFARPHRVIAFCLLAFVIASASLPLPFPARRADRPSTIAIHLPFRGEWTVAWGGEGDANFLLRTRPDRCFGYVFVVQRDGSTRANANDPRSAYAFDQPVLAPCAGVVASVVDRWPDDGASATDDLGNHIVLEIAPEEFLFLGCLKQGATLVKAGDHVAAGQELARVGWSAVTRLAPEPHLAMHLQDTPLPLEGQGIPFEFRDFFAGERSVPRGRPHGAGLFVGHMPTGERIRQR